MARRTKGALALLLCSAGSCDAAWRLTFADEFDAAGLNASNWKVAAGGTHGAEQQLYTADEVWVRDGLLTLRTRRNPVECATPARPPGPSDGHGWCLPLNSSLETRRFNFTSGWLDTEGRFAQRYGRFSVRARLPDVRAANAWPAHWLMPDTTTASCTSSPGACAWPVGGEIDIMESYGAREDGNVFGTYHWADEAGRDLHCGGSTPARRCAPYNFSGRFPGVPADFSSHFHVYSVDWNASSIVWSVDGTSYWERHDGDRPGTDHSAKVCAHPMYLILNTAISAEPTLPAQPAHYPVVHEVDWVRVWEWV